MEKTLEQLGGLIGIIRRLRGPGGCPWDRKQTPADVKNYLVEELYEVLEAVDGGVPGRIAEETGDLLFMLLFLTALYEEQKAFSLGDVIGTIRDKMVRRHPHVFGSTSVSGPEEVTANWQAIKEKEGKAPRTSVLDGVARNLPALSRAYYLTARASDAGFDWPSPAGVLQKIREEIGELEAELDRQDRRQAAGEIGDLIFSIVNLARQLDIEPEQALRRTNEKFVRRFTYVEKALQQRGTDPAQATLEDMDALWEEAKQRERAEA